jgi:hypothetical protein
MQGRDTTFDHAFFAFCEVLTADQLLQANILVAMLAGFWARKSDGHPGAKLLGQGLRILAELVNYHRLTGRTPNTRPFPSKRPRKPG